MGKKKDWTKRFYAKIKLDASGCWEWTACKNHDGYGVFGLNGKAEYAHRVAYRLHRGVIIRQIDHLCGNRGCVNPAHLDDVPQVVNVRRGRNSCREKTHCPRGHPYSGENLYTAANGNRQCKECKTANMRLYRARRKEAAQ